MSSSPLACCNFSTRDICHVQFSSMTVAICEQRGSSNGPSHEPPGWKHWRVRMVKFPLPIPQRKGTYSSSTTMLATKALLERLGSFQGGHPNHPAPWESRSSKIACRASKLPAIAARSVLVQRNLVSMKLPRSTKCALRSFNDSKVRRQHHMAHSCSPTTSALHSKTTPWAFISSSMMGTRCLAIEGSSG